ncbi:hypothetical protein Mtc_2321 [Methanocella conradii HZ254]|uniref:Uncharacterized protein n=1 Tax=Methanocella conradii (strain DSM 24694 / JCM 17849 / CGMCC 1.5162 / HZ254) TaxID=1041930 RepID=H8I4W0_METCZ|nr:hypothetical protein [Methanocella conradii]AFD01054.1 hypothetical protein Mtc_2321 [Methanocella conradii HZ254]
MDSIASAAIKHASKRTRELLFQPLDLRFLALSSLRFPLNDRRSEELKRLTPYHKGTRILAMVAILMLLPALVLPFTSPIIGLNGVLALLFIYIAALIAVSIIVMPLEASLDAVLAIKYESGVSLSNAVRTFVGYALENPGQAASYMGAKLLLDMMLMTLVLLLFMPSLVTLIAIMLCLIKAVSAGASDVLGVAITGFLAAGALAMAAALLTMLLAVPISAFYGYYTEEAVRLMKEAAGGRE